MLSKKWVPICCFPEESEAEQALEESFDVSSVELSRLEKLFSILADFTARVEHLHYNELVMGAVDGGATFDMELVRDTMIKESYEEALKEGLEVGLDLSREQKESHYSKKFTKSQNEF